MSFSTWIPSLRAEPRGKCLLTQWKWGGGGRGSRQVKITSVDSCGWGNDLFPAGLQGSGEWRSWSAQLLISISCSFLDSVSLSLPAASPAPQFPHPGPAVRCSACYCTLSNTCWQLPGITPDRGRCSSSARGAGVWAKPCAAAASIFTRSTSKGNFF